MNKYCALPNLMHTRIELLYCPLLKEQVGISGDLFPFLPRIRQ